MRPSTTRAAALLGVLAVFAMAKVVLGALSFPLFGHMDELPHCDVVMRYAAGSFPLRDGDRFAAPAIAIHELWASPEYGFAPGPDGPGLINGQLPWPSDKARDTHVAGAVERASTAANHEAYEPPPYYAAAAAWLHLGRLCGVEGRMQIYWLRSLGGIALALAVVFGALFLRCLVPDQPLVWLGAAAMTAAWPQDVVYFVNNDVLNIALFPICLWLVARMSAAAKETGTISARRAIATGTAVGIAVMTKGTSLPLLFVAGALLAPTAWAALRDRQKTSLIALTLFAACAVGPTAIWQAMTYAYTGTVGATHKLSALTITPRPMAEWWDHPLFSLAGLQTYTSHLMRYFWRGELLWHGEEMGHALIDACWLASLTLFAASLFRSVLRKTPSLPALLAGPAWIGVLSGVGILMLLSISHDYGGNQYPSKDFPYFTSGRLLGGLFPLVAALWIDGARGVGRLIHPRAASALLLLWIFACLVSEAILMAPVVGSPHNVWNLDV